MNQMQLLPSWRPPSREGVSDAPRTELLTLYLGLIPLSARATWLLQSQGFFGLGQDLLLELVVPYKDI